MHISENVVSDILVARINGELDMNSAGKFRDFVTSKMDELELNHLILNLREMKFIDSTGLGAILGRYRNLEKDNGKILLVGLNPVVKRVFSISGLLKIMKEYPSEKEAIKAVKKAKIGGQK